VAKDIRFEQGDVRELAPAKDMAAGSICTNPPYGERLMGAAGAPRTSRETGRPRKSAPESTAIPDPRTAHVSRLKLQGLYRGMAEALSQFHGWTVVFLSGSPLLENAMHVRPEVTHRLWNGPLEVKLLRYRIK